MQKTLDEIIDDALQKGEQAKDHLPKETREIVDRIESLLREAQRLHSEYGW